MLKVVVIGGGNGSATTINALKQNLDKFVISAVISMSDSGGSSGRLREEFKTVPPGDIMRAVLAMSRYNYPLLKQIFYRNRFSEVGKLDKHDLGNLFLVLAEKYSGDFMNGIRSLGQAVEAVGQVYPATLEQTHLVAELSNGEIVRTEAKIDRPDYDHKLKIKKVWLEPTGKIYSEAKKTIEEADYILFGPGSLYCSIVAAILPTGAKEAIKNSQAKLIYVAGNACEEAGETGPDTLTGFINGLESYLPRSLDLIIYNNHQPTKKEIERYREKEWKVFMDDCVDKKSDKRIIKGDYERDGGGLCDVKLGKMLKRELK